MPHTTLLENPERVVAQHLGQWYPHRCPSRSLSLLSVSREVAFKEGPALGGRPAERTTSKHFMLGGGGVSGGKEGHFYKGKNPRAWPLPPSGWPGVLAELPLMGAVWQDGIHTRFLAVGTLTVPHPLSSQRNKCTRRGIPGREMWGGPWRPGLWSPSL